MPILVRQQLLQKRQSEIGHRGKRLEEERRQRMVARLQSSGASEREFRYPSDSHVQYEIPLSRDALLRESYTNFFKQLRIGKLFEDLDAIAGEIAYQHCLGSSSPMTIVTASIDRVTIRSLLTSEEDVLIDGNVSWVGRSSMEVNARVMQGIEKRVVADALFLMVARDPTRNVSVAVPPLHIQTKEEQDLFSQGELRKAERIERAKKSLSIAPPSEDERLIIHRLYLESRKNRHLEELGLSGRTRIGGTRLSKALIVHPQERNIHQKAFGGFLIREAFELAWIAAYQFSRQRPVFVSLEDNTFLRPVELGSVLEFNAQVSYSHRSSSMIVTRVEADIVDPVTHERERTNLFHFTFRTPVPSEVIPHTYEESMEYIEGLRIFNSLRQDSRDFRERTSI